MFGVATFFNEASLTSASSKYFSTDLDNSVELYKEFDKKVKEQLIKNDVNEDIMRNRDFELIMQNTYLKKFLPET